MALQRPIGNAMKGRRTLLNSDHQKALENNFEYYFYSEGDSGFGGSYT